MSHGIREAMVESGVRCPTCRGRPHDPEVLWYANEENVERCADAFHTPKREDPKCEFCGRVRPLARHYSSGYDVCADARECSDYCRRTFEQCSKRDDPSWKVGEGERLTLLNNPSDGDTCTISPVPSAPTPRRSPVAARLSPQSSAVPPHPLPHHSPIGDDGRDGTMDDDGTTGRHRELIDDDLCGASGVSRPFDGVGLNPDVLGPPFDPNPPKLETGGYGFRMCLTCSTVVDASVGHECANALGRGECWTIGCAELSEWEATGSGACNFCSKHKDDLDGLIPWTKKPWGHRETKGLLEHAEARAEFAESVLCALAFDVQRLVIDVRHGEGCDPGHPDRDCIFCVAKKGKLDAARGE